MNDNDDFSENTGDDDGVYKITMDVQDFSTIAENEDDAYPKARDFQQFAVITEGNVSVTGETIMLST